MSKQSTPSPPSPKEIELVSLAQFIEFIKKIMKSNGTTMAYRGHASEEWELDPGILRTYNSGLLREERGITRDMISVHPHEFINDLTMFDRLVRMQHFGLPTRLLDVSLNPLVALYFAVSDATYDGKDGVFYYVSIPRNRRKYFDSDTVSCLCNLANLSEDEKNAISKVMHGDRRAFNASSAVDRLVQFVRAEKPYFRSDINPLDLYRTCYVVPKLNNRRIIAQSGAFMIEGLPAHKDVPEYEKSIEYEGVIIPADAKSGLRKELDVLSINESTLFPEIEKAASYISRRYRE